MRARQVWQQVLLLGSLGFALGAGGCLTEAAAPGPVAAADAGTVDASAAVFGTTANGELRHALVPGFHRPEGSMINWATNPPSSGDHCGSWGQWAIYPPSNPLARCHYVHNLEHGGVVLLYKCPEGCPDTVKALERLIAQAPADPDCGSAKRFILTPDTMIDSLVAASAWGFTWKADAWSDAAADGLARFMTAHIGTRGLSPEPDICSGGSVRP